MNNDKIGDLISDQIVERDLDEQIRTGKSIYEPISTRQYFKVLVYCVLALLLVGVFIGLFFNYVG